MRLSTAAEAFLSTKRQEGFSKHTLTAYRFVFQKLVTDLNDIEIEQITLHDLREHMSHYEYLKPSSQAHKVRAIKSLFKWLCEEEYLIRNPALKFKEPKLPQRVPKALSIEEIELLRDSCKTVREHALLEFFFATGCRVGEVHNLNRNAIDWSRQSCVVFGKGSKEREVYFGAKAAIWLRRYLAQRRDSDIALFATQNKPYKRLPIHEIQRVFKTVAARCGLAERVSPHKMRHTLATALLNQGAPLAAVQSILGHEKPETTQIYAHLSGSARQQAYNRYFVQ